MDNILPKYLLNKDADTAVLFIHGLGGSYNTWKDFSHGLHQKWTDSNEVDAYSLEYDSYYSKTNILFKNAKGQSINKLADHLDSFIKTVCDKYKKIILVCHSMGGLVARKYILNTLNKYRSLGKIKALITYATPHHGSKLANIALALLRNPIYFFSFGALKLFEQHKDLSKNSDFIKNLNLEWSNLNVSSKLDFYRVVGLADYVVDETSAEFELDENVYKFANKNHFTIIKPDLNINDNALYVTYNYLKNFNNINLERDFQINSDDDYNTDDDYDY